MNQLWMYVTGGILKHTSYLSSANCSDHHLRISGFTKSIHDELPAMWSYTSRDSHMTETQRSCDPTWPAPSLINRGVVSFLDVVAITLSLLTVVRNRKDKPHTDIQGQEDMWMYTNFVDEVVSISLYVWINNSHHLLHIHTYTHSLISASLCYIVLLFSTFLPFWASLFCMSVGVGNLPESHVKYLISWKNIHFVSCCKLPATPLTFCHQCVRCPATEHRMEYHVGQTLHPHCIAHHGNN